MTTRSLFLMILMAAFVFSAHAEQFIGLQTKLQPEAFVQKYSGLFGDKKWAVKNSRKLPDGTYLVPFKGLKIVVYGDEPYAATVRLEKAGSAVYRLGDTQIQGPNVKGHKTAITTGTATGMLE